MEQPLEDCYLLTQGHNVIVDYLRKSGVPTNAVPFPTTVYVTDSGENHSGYWLRELRAKRLILRHAVNSRPLTRSIRKEFGLDAASTAR
jgi:hypothetical protein